MPVSLYIHPYVLMLLCVCPYAIMRVSHPRSKGRLRRREIRRRWNNVRTQIPRCLEELNWKLDDDEGRNFFTMVCPYVFVHVSLCFSKCVLMLVCVYPYDDMRMSL